MGAARTRTRDREALLDYGVPEGNGGATVINKSFLKNGNCSAVDFEVEDYLQAEIGRVFVGHAPHGQCPSVIKYNALDVFVCDTSYSDMKASKAENPANNRGDVCSVISITKDFTKVQGKFVDGKENKYCLWMARFAHGVRHKRPTLYNVLSSLLNDLVAKWRADTTIFAGPPP